MAVRTWMDRPLSYKVGAASGVIVGVLAGVFTGFFLAAFVGNVVQKIK